ncbi:IS110 family transposase [Paenibacillus sp. LMG 31458]|uniref:IS110 family transposase n=1 Tax=Paenibacillus phytorum TaxID=2654977 RepID=A0ABX1Y4L4_9BACL|nr:IS110 family transposase [Paenibacillus phytorum]NOU75701.1 IS110 family transposase [Paenibacillus phytorum]
MRLVSNWVVPLAPHRTCWWNLANWLTNKGTNVVLVNPATTKRNKENRDNSPSKSDPKDALVIADIVSRGYYYEHTRQTQEFQRLRAMMSDREFWVVYSVRLQNRIILWLDIRFPEYTSVFKDWTCKRSLATLKELPLPQDLASRSVTDMITTWRKHMHRAGGSTGTQKAAELISQAKRSVGDVTALTEAKQDLERLIAEYERVVEMLGDVQKQILAILSEIPIASLLRSIKGLGPIFVAAILAGAGDLRQYTHGRQFLRKAGLNLAESTSGKRKGQIVISKRGDSTLRKYLFLATTQLIGVNPVFQKLHEYNVKVKHMKKQRSVFKLLGKVARILISIVQKGETFSPEKASNIITQAA